MATPSEYKISNLETYIAAIEKIRSLSGQSLWFRGCGDSAHELKPTLYRQKFRKDIESFIELEAELLLRFQQRSIPFRTREFVDNWEWLFFMQHFGIPTRLLDWTENPLTALFFAVTSCRHHLQSNGEAAFVNPASVWVLNPEQWNKQSVNLKSFPGKILSTNDSNLAAYKPVSDCSLMREYPLAIYGSHNSQRIVAQRGVFVVFGKSTTPMEDTFDAGNFPKHSLSKITFSKSALPKLLESLRGNGITDSVVYPDLDGLAREIRREFKF